MLIFEERVRKLDGVLQTNLVFSSMEVESRGLGRHWVNLDKSKVSEDLAASHVKKG